MANTDGFINGGDDCWQYTYWADADCESPAPDDAAWVRVERMGGPIPGFAVSGGGQVVAGPTVDLGASGSLEDKVAAEEFDFDPENDTAQQLTNQIKILWAGVSPRRQDVGLIVLSSDKIRLLRPGRITSRQGPAVLSVSQAGRVLAVRLDGPVSMSGVDYLVLEFAAGALGFQTSISYQADNAQARLRVDCGQPDGQPDYTLPQPELGQCEGLSVKWGDENLPQPLEEEDDDQRAGEQLLSACPAEEDGDRLVAQVEIVNCRWTTVPLRVTHPFALTQAKVCQCEGDCSEIAPVWLMAYNYFGTIAPLEPAPLNKLFDARLQDVDNEVPAVSRSLMGPFTTPYTVHVQTAAGQTHPVTSVYNATDYTIYPGQGGRLLYKCESYCAFNCVSTFTPDTAVQYVTEDIVKPTEREFNVDFFERFILTELTFEIPTDFEDKEFDLPTKIDVAPTLLPTEVLMAPLTVIESSAKVTVTLPTAVESQTVNVPKAEIEEVTLLTNVLSEERSIITQVDFAPTDVITNLLYQSIDLPTDLATESRSYVTEIAETTAEYPVSVDFGPSTFPTSVDTTPMTLATNVLLDSVDIPGNVGQQDFNIPTGLDFGSAQVVTGVTPAGFSLNVCDAQGNSSTVTVVTGLTPEYAPLSALVTVEEQVVSLPTSSGDPVTISYPTAAVEATYQVPAVVKQATYQLPAGVNQQSFTVPDSPLFRDFDVPTAPLLQAFTVPTAPVEQSFDVPIAPLLADYLVPTAAEEAEYKIPTDITTTPFTFTTKVLTEDKEVDVVTTKTENLPTEIKSHTVDIPTNIESNIVTIKQPKEVGGVVEVRALVADEEGDITCVTETTPDCEVTFKWINRGDEILQATNPQNDVGSCLSGRNFNAHTFAIEATDCSDVKLARCLYVGMPSATMSFERAPGYDGTPELPPDNPSGRMMGGGSAFATVQVPRLERHTTVDPSLDLIRFVQRPEA